MSDRSPILCVMPLRIVRASTSAALLDACLEQFFGLLGDHAGPEPHSARLWVAHRVQRDATLAAAAAVGLPGWFDPPVHFLSELRHLFGIRARPVGLVTARLLVARLAREHGARFNMQGQSAETGPARSHLLDSVYGDLLAEGVDEQDLRTALAVLGDEEFTRRRNDWVVDTYAGLREALSAQGLYDARQIHALAAEQVESGRLGEAVRGAGTLLIYGITSLRQRRRLFRALTDQHEVDVAVFLLREPEQSEWESLTTEIKDIEDSPAGRTVVQPVPDAVREAEYVARCVKRLLVEQGCAPRDIAVVARSGRADAGRMYAALQDSGVPATARLRSTFAEVPALKALLDLFRAQADGWDYRSLRSILMTPYFGEPLDPAVLDFLASRCRIHGLDGWRAAVEDLSGDFEGRDDRALRSHGLCAEQIRRTGDRLVGLQEAVLPMAEEHSEFEWIQLTRMITGGTGFGFRERLCRVVGERYEVVRLDQQAVTMLDSLLHEWMGLIKRHTRIPASEWHTRLRRLFEANELALTTPMREGVQILEAHEAAITPFRHVFVVHANDGEFPRSAGGGGIFSDRETAALRRAGLPLEDRALSLRRERSLWRAVTAGSSVTLTYRTATDGGAPLLPSLMVPSHDATTVLPRTVALRHDQGAISAADRLRHDVLELERNRQRGDSSPIAVADVHSVRHAVLMAFAEELRAGNLDTVPGIEKTIGLTPGSQLEAERPVSERAHAYAGWLRDPVVLTALAERFGPDHVWSAAQLQAYTVRPFDFLVHRVLRIQDQAEAEEETAPLASGSVAHLVLESFHRRLFEAGDTEFTGAELLLDEVCDEVFQQVERDAELWLGLPPMWRIKREHLRRTIRQFVDWDIRALGKKQAHPVAVEQVFGMDGSEPIRLEGLDVEGHPAHLLLSGRIDRIDRLKSGGLRIIDYKWSAVPGKGNYTDGAVLQSAVYMRAWDQVAGEVVEDGVFLSVRNPGAGSGSGLPAANVDAVLRFALSSPARIRAGLFEPVQARSLGKINYWQPGPEITRTQRVLRAGSRFERQEESEAVSG